VAGALLGATGAVKSGVSASGTVTGLVIAVAVSAGAALVTSAIPIWRAVNRPPIKSLSAS
jgi:hypothetical protein